MANVSRDVAFAIAKGAEAEIPNRSMNCNLAHISKTRTDKVLAACALYFDRNQGDYRAIDALIEQFAEMQLDRTEHLRRRDLF